MNQLKKLASDTITYGLSSIVGRLLNYLLVPFYTSVLLPAEYGIITELYAYLAFLNIIYTYGMETAYLRFATSSSSVKTFRIINSILLFTSIIFSSILIALASPLVNYLGYLGKEIYIYLMAAILSVDTLLVLPFARLRLCNKAMYFSKLKCWQIGMTMVLNICFLYLLPQLSVSRCNFWGIDYISSFDPITYILLANMLANISILPWLGLSWKHFTYLLEGKEVQKIFVYGLPLLVMGIGGIINEMLSRILLKHILPMHLYPDQSREAVLGIFGACYKLTMFMSVAMQAFRYAVEPFFFKHAGEQESLCLFSKVMQVYILLCCWVWLAISINTDLLALIFLRNSIYRSGTDMVPYLALSYLWLGIYYNLAIWFKVVNKNYYGTVITMLGAMVTVLLNVALVPYWGYMGSVWATLCSYFCMAFMCYYLGRRYYPVPYKVWNGLWMIAITGVLIIIVKQFQCSDMGCAVVGNMVWTIISGGVVYRYILKLV